MQPFNTNARIKASPLAMPCGSPPDQPRRSARRFQLLIACSTPPSYDATHNRDGDADRRIFAYTTVIHLPGSATISAVGNNKLVDLKAFQASPGTNICWPTPRHLVSGTGRPDPSRGCAGRRTSHSGPRCRTRSEGGSCNHQPGHPTTSEPSKHAFQIRPGLVPTGPNQPGQTDAPQQL